MDTGLPAGAAAATKRDAALHHLASMTQCATWAWTDGSATGGVLRGGAGALISYADDDCVELKNPAGGAVLKFPSEDDLMTLDHLLEHPRDVTSPVIMCTDSMSSLAALRGEQSAQRSVLGARVWQRLLAIASGDRSVTLQWVPSQCEVPGNEAANALTNGAASMDQETAPWTSPPYTRQQPATPETVRPGRGRPTRTPPGSRPRGGTRN